MLKLNLAPSRLFFALVLALALCAPAQAAPDQLDFFRAVQLDRPAWMKKMLAQGFDPNTREPQRGDTAMIAALREDSNDAFMLLLEQPGIDLEAGSGNGDTALMMASYKKNKAAVLALLAKGAEVNRPGWTPLHYAAAAGDVEICEILLSYHARVDAYAPNRLTPLMFAAREGQDRTVKVLLEAGADASLVSVYGLTASQFADSADKPYVSKIIAAFLAARSGR